MLLLKVGGDMKEKTKAFTKAEIIKKLKWFHGEEFKKYPLIEESFIWDTENSSIK